MRPTVKVQDMTGAMLVSEWARPGRAQSTKLRITGSSLDSRTVVDYARRVVRIAELAGDKRRVIVEGSDFAPLREIATSYPADLIEAIEAVKGAYVCDEIAR